MKLTVCRTRMIMQEPSCSYDVWIKPEDMTPAQREKCCHWIIHEGVKYANFSSEYRVYFGSVTDRIQQYEHYEETQPRIEAEIVRKVCPEMVADKLPTLWMAVPPEIQSGLWEVDW